MFGGGDFPIKGLGEIADCFIGLTYKPSDICEDGVVVLRSGNIQKNTVDLNDMVRVNTSIKEKLYVQANDILMCSRNGSADLVGKTALIPQLSELMTFGAFMTVIRSKYSRYLFAFFQSDSFREQTAMAKTSTINQITKAMLDNIKVPLPPLPLQNRFAAFAEAADKSKLADVPKKVESPDKKMRGGLRYAA